MPQHQIEHLNRREFIKLFGLGLAGLFLPDTKFNTAEKSPEGRSLTEQSIKMIHYLTEASRSNNQNQINESHKVFLIWIAGHGMAYAAPAAGLKLSAKAMGHYLDCSGTPIDLSFDRYFNQQLFDNTSQPSLLSQIIAKTINDNQPGLNDQPLDQAQLLLIDIFRRSRISGIFQASPSTHRDLQLALGHTTYVLENTHYQQNGQPPFTLNRIVDKLQIRLIPNKLFSSLHFLDPWDFKSQGDFMLPLGFINRFVNLAKNSLPDKISEALIGIANPILNYSIAQNLIKVEKGHYYFPSENMNLLVDHDFAIPFNFQYSTLDIGSKPITINL